MTKIPKERFSLPRTFLKPKRSKARFRPVAVIVGEAFLSYFGPIIRHHAGKDLDLNAKISLPRVVLSQDDPWNMWEPFANRKNTVPIYLGHWPDELAPPGIRIRTGVDLETAANAIDILFADKKVGRELLAFIKESKKINREREKKLLSSAEMFAGWFAIFFGDWMADALAPIIGPGRRLSDSDIIGLTAYLFRKNKVNIANDTVGEIKSRDKAIGRAFYRWKNTVT